MKKSKIFGLITEAIYLIAFIASLALAFSLKVSLDAAREQNAEQAGEAIGIALSAAVILILMILVLIYAVFTALPLIFKTVQLFVPKRPFSIVCMIFDVASFAIFVLLLVSSITSDFNAATLAVSCAGALLFVAAFVLNLFTYRALDDEEVDQMLDDMIDSVELDGQNPPD